MIKKNMIIIYCVTAILVIGNVFQLVWNYSSLPLNVVPDAETAIIIAQTVLIASYDKDLLEPLDLLVGLYSRTFDVTFNKLKRAWVVSVELPRVEGVLLHGWTIDIVVRMRDARIISIRHR